MRTVIIASLLILCSCVSNDVLMSSANATSNVDRINQLQIGMTQEEVYQIMRYPSREDQVVTDDGCYDVWFYVTKASVLGQSHPVARNLTPLIFKDGVFIGMGREYYNSLTRKTKEPSPASPTTPVTTPTPANSEPENYDLEKSLAPANSPETSTNKKQKAPPQPTPVQQAQPAAPSQTQPAVKPAKKTSKSKPLSMSSKPKQTKKVKEPSKKTDENDSKKPELDEEDREMLDLEQEQNFNEW